MKAIVGIVVAIGIAISSLIVSMKNKTPKIGYVETSILISEFSEAIRARKQLEEMQKEWQGNVKQLNDSISAAMEIMKRDYDKASDGQKKFMRGQFQKRNEDYQRYSEAVKRMAAEKEREVMDPIIKKINGFMDLWGKQNGFGLIFGTTSGGNILQADAALNLTPIILKALNDQYLDSAPAPNKEIPKKDSSASPVN